jgi:hypothetical protein
MPTIQVNLHTDGAFVSSPFTIPFTIPIHETSHRNFPLYFTSFGAVFPTNTALPNTFTVSLTNLELDKQHNTIYFPLPGHNAVLPSYHYFTHQHLGTVSPQTCVEGRLVLSAPSTFRLPTRISLVFFIESQYM